MIFDTNILSQAIKAVEYVSSLAGKLVEIKEYKPKRTNLQNSYYWAVLACISENTGEDVDALHIFFKSKFLTYQVKEYQVFGKIMISDTSTTKLNTKEFTDYIEKISVFIADFGIQIPRPEDKNFNDFLEHYKNYI